MLEEVIALFHRPLMGAFIANAHLPISWQVSPLRAFQESIAVLIAADGTIFTAPVDVLDAVPIDLEFTEVRRDQFRREIPLIRDKRVFAIRTSRKKDYLFTPELLKTEQFSSAEDYWDYLVG